MESTYCRRCDDLVATIDPWPHWGKAWLLWMGGIGVFLCASPFIIGDFCVVQPSLMLYLVAGSVLHREKKARSVCARCSLELDRGARGGTTIRPKPSS